MCNQGAQVMRQLSIHVRARWFSFVLSLARQCECGRVATTRFLLPVRVFSIFYSDDSFFNWIQKSSTFLYHHSDSIKQRAEQPIDKERKRDWDKQIGKKDSFLIPFFSIPYSSFCHLCFKGVSCSSSQIYIMMKIKTQDYLFHTKLNLNENVGTPINSKHEDNGKRNKW